MIGLLTIACANCPARVRLGVADAAGNAGHMVVAEALEAHPQGPVETLCGTLIEAPGTATGKPWCVGCHEILVKDLVVV